LPNANFCGRKKLFNGSFNDLIKEFVKAVFAEQPQELLDLLNRWYLRYNACELNKTEISFPLSGFLGP
jgi:hypothetical protein